MTNPAPPPSPTADTAPTDGPVPRRKRRRDDVMVPDAQFSSYYGRPIVKPAPWKHEIPAYLFLGGLAAGSALIAAGGEMTGREELQRNGRLVTLAALAGSTYALIADLGKPSRFLNMMRTVKLTSPMSVGSWILAGFGAFSGLAATSEVTKLLAPMPSWLHELARWTDRPASLGAGAFAAPLAAYTSVLLSNTATPTWHESYRHLPYVFVGSALAASGGAAMVTTSPRETTPARRMALVGSALEVTSYHLMTKHLGMLAEPLEQGHAGKLMKASTALTVAGAVLTALGAGKRRSTAVVAGFCFLGGSLATRFGVVEAGQESARDPKYTVEPQKQRLAQKRAQAEAALLADPTSITPSP